MHSTREVKALRLRKEGLIRRINVERSQSVEAVRTLIAPVVLFDQGMKLWRFLEGVLSKGD